MAPSNDLVDIDSMFDMFLNDNLFASNGKMMPYSEQSNIFYNLGNKKSSSLSNEKSSRLSTRAKKSTSSQGTLKDPATGDPQIIDHVNENISPRCVKDHTSSIIEKRRFDFVSISLHEPQLTIDKLTQRKK